MPQICPHFLWCPAAPWAAFVPILLSEVEQEQRPSGNGDREAIVVGAGLCDREGERAYTVYDPTLFLRRYSNLDLSYGACFLDLSSSDLSYEISLELIPQTLVAVPVNAQIANTNTILIFGPIPNTINC